MRIPEPLFVIINTVMRLVLRSPLHRIFSSSIMLITFTGRNSGRTFTTPVRYVGDGELVHCFTAKENQWWRNLRGGANVVLRIAGEEQTFHASALTDDPALIRKRLTHYLGLYPQDAAYHEIRLNKDKSLVAEDLERASHNAVAVECRRI